tara:strand:- start:1253 stop:1900 length:648 start_codon:yes stop_codon:yes gene_type:complete
MSKSYIPTLKVCILGNTDVGKTCLSNKLIKNDKYVHNYLEEPTIGASFMCKTYKLNNKAYKINIWDTAGQERYRSLASMYYRDVVVAVIVYDITNYESWLDKDYWINKLRKNTPDSSILVVGNKYDLAERIKIDMSEIDEFTSLNPDIKHIFFSTKDKNSNSSKILDIIVDEYKDKIEKGILFNIPLYETKKNSVALDKERYWCSYTFNNIFGCC